MVHRLLLMAGAITAGLCAGAASAEADLSLSATFTVPGLSGPIRLIEMADVDGDGSAEVLVFDGASFVLYSPADDTTLLAFGIDSVMASLDTTGCDWANFDLRILLADVNRDSLVDAAILISFPCGPTNPYTSSYIWRHTLTFIDDVTSGNPPSAPLELAFESALGIGMLDAVDFDGDGYDNLIVSVDSSVFWEIPPSFAWDDSYGKTLLYHSFPDSQFARVDVNLARVWPISLSNGDPGLVAFEEDYSWQDYMGIGPQETSTTGVTLLRPDGEILSRRIRSDPPVCTDDGLGANWFSFLGPQIVGDFIPATPQTEVICTYADYEFSANCAFEAFELVAFEITDADTLREIWSVDIQTADHGTFLAHPSFPGRFLAIVSTTLTLFDATDGSVVRQYDPLPFGAKSWVYPYGDGVPHLMLVSDQTVSYYTLDEVTDVQTETPSALPATFTLGEPYPNPFNPVVTIPLAVDRKGHLRVDVFNPLGQRVATLHDAVATPGETTFSWDASDFGSGVYLIKATLGDESKTVKAVLVK